jgi:hypothetical protein
MDDTSMTPDEKQARARLGEMIANHNAIEGELSKTQGVLGDARRKLGTMLDEADQAEARKVEAMDAEVTRILSGAQKAKGGLQSPALTEDDLALQRHLISRLEGLVDEREHALAAAKRAVSAGVSGVVAAKVHDLIPEFEKVRAEFARLAAVFNAARSAIEFDRNRDSPYGRVDALLRQEPGGAIRFAGLAPAEEARWRTQIAQLSRDPNAPLLH